MSDFEFTGDLEAFHEIERQCDSLIPSGSRASSGDKCVICSRELTEAEADGQVCYACQDSDNIEESNDEN